MGLRLSLITIIQNMGRNIDTILHIYPSFYAHFHYQLHIHVIRRINSNVMWKPKLTITSSFCTPTGNEVTITVEFFNGFKASRIIIILVPYFFFYRGESMLLLHRAYKEYKYCVLVNNNIQSKKVSLVSVAIYFLNSI
jgi:hypothetical protein